MITTEHASNSPVMFVTHESFAVFFSLPSLCVNSLLLALCSEKLYNAIQDLFPGPSSASPILSHGYISEELLCLRQGFSWTYKRDSKSWALESAVCVWRLSVVFATRGGHAHVLVRSQSPSELSPTVFQIGDKPRDRQIFWWGKLLFLFIY